MNKPLTIYRLWCLFFIFVAFSTCPWTATAAEDSHDDHDDHDEAVELVFSAAERRAAGIETAPVARRVIQDTLRLPGEVIPNAYRSASVGSRISGQVVRRYAVLGDVVAAGDPLVTLSSVPMADAQGELIVAAVEWQRVRKLGSEVVSERRFTEAEVAHQLALAKVIAYGMTEGQAQALIEKGDASLANGDFALVAPQDGTVVRDEFFMGEFIEPGRALFEITDEHTLWVEARTSAGKIGSIATGMPARVSPDNREWRDARVIQIHHRLDEMTRTQAVRVELDNQDDWLHPGEFVEVEITVGGGEPVLAVPSESVVLLKGSSVIFELENEREFHPVPVEQGVTSGDWTQIVAGVEAGDVIATRGTFYLKSLLLKSELGDGHAH